MTGREQSRLREHRGSALEHWPAVRVNFFTREELYQQQPEGRRETRWVVLLEMDWLVVAWGSGIN